MLWVRCSKGNSVRPVVGRYFRIDAGDVKGADGSAAANTYSNNQLPAMSAPIVEVVGKRWGRSASAGSWLIQPKLPLPLSVYHPLLETVAIKFFCFLCDSFGGYCCVV